MFKGNKNIRTNINNKTKVVSKNRILTDKEIPEIAEYAAFYSAGYIEGKGRAVLLIDKKIYNC